MNQFNKRVQIAPIIMIFGVQFERFSFRGEYLSNEKKCIHHQSGITTGSTKLIAISEGSVGTVAFMLVLSMFNKWAGDSEIKIE